MNTNATRKHPVIRTRCPKCGVRMVGELRPDGRLYAARHPERVEGEEQSFICIDCAEKEQR